MGENGGRGTGWNKADIYSIISVHVGIATDTFSSINSMNMGETSIRVDVWLVAINVCDVCLFVLIFRTTKQLLLLKYIHMWKSLSKFTKLKQYTDPIEDQCRATIYKSFKSNHMLSIENEPFFCLRLFQCSRSFSHRTELSDVFLCHTIPSTLGGGGVMNNEFVLFLVWLFSTLTVPLCSHYPYAPKTLWFHSIENHREDVHHVLLPLKFPPNYAHKSTTAQINVFSYLTGIKTKWIDEIAHL